MPARGTNIIPPRSYGAADGAGRPGGGQRPWQSAIRGLYTMRNMEEGQAVTLGASVIAVAQMRRAAGATGNGDDRRRWVICSVLCGLGSALVCFFVFVDTGSITLPKKHRSTSSGTVKVATSPSPVAAPTPSPVVSATPRPTASLVVTATTLAPTLTPTPTPTPSAAGAIVTLGRKLWGTDFCDESDDFLSAFSTAAGEWSSSKCGMRNSDTWEPLALAWLDMQVSSAWLAEGTRQDDHDSCFQSPSHAQETDLAFDPIII